MGLGVNGKITYLPASCLDESFGMDAARRRVELISGVGGMSFISVQKYRGFEISRLVFCEGFGCKWFDFMELRGSYLFF